MCGLAGPHLNFLSLSSSKSHTNSRRVETVEDLEGIKTRVTFV